MVARWARKLGAMVEGDGSVGMLVLKYILSMPHPNKKVLLPSLFSFCSFLEMIFYLLHCLHYFDEATFLVFVSYLYNAKATVTDFKRRENRNK